jgi:F0F1-type ATP synthase membrane subunit c/vacuolar-type H+-ATPase subunit K
MQLRTLILQKHHDRVWIACLILVCASILIQLGFGYILYRLVKGDIRNPEKQPTLERYNKFGLFIIIIVTIINVAINILMLTINPKSFLDARSLELLQQKI